MLERNDAHQLVTATSPQENHDVKPQDRKQRYSERRRRPRHQKSGNWEPVNAGTSIDALPDDAVVARVSNSRKSASITAGDIATQD